MTSDNRRANIGDELALAFARHAIVFPRHCDRAVRDFVRVAAAPRFG